MNIGFIGVGNMGGPMARNLLTDGFEVTVHDIRREAATSLEELGAKWAESPKEVARASEVVMSSLPGPPEVDAAALGPLGIIEGIKPGTVYIDLSSISPDLARGMYRAFKEKGAEVMDAPISGGVVGATNRTMVIMVGGDEAIFNKYKSLLEHLGDKIIHTGEIGSGSVSKLVHNCMSSTARLAVIEGFTLGVKAGVDPMALWRAVRWGIFGRTSPIEDLGDNLFAGEFDSVAFALKPASKDVSRASWMARECQVPMSLSSLAEQEILEAMARGWGNRDFSAADLLQEERSGVQVRIPDFSSE